MPRTISVVNQLRQAMRRSGRSLYEISRKADIGYAVVHRIASGERQDLRMGTMTKLARVLGLRLELRPITDCDDIPNPKPRKQRAR